AVGAGFCRGRAGGCALGCRRGLNDGRQRSRADARQYSENLSRSAGKSVVSPGSACSQALTSPAGNPAAASHSFELISVVTALDTSQNADPVKAQPREHQTPLTPAHSASKTRVNALMLGVQRGHSLRLRVPACAGTNGSWSATALRRLLEIFPEVCAHADKRRNRELGQRKLEPGHLFIDVDIGGR